MKRIFANLITFSLIVFFFAAAPTAGAQALDVIGVRVYSNPNNFSALRWYKEKGFDGSPQSTIVDGYEAVRDGRTVYVNAANINGSTMYTNIYLISYNQEPQPTTVDIFGQLLSNWEFNADLNTENFCFSSELSGYNCPTDACPADFTCDISDNTCKTACLIDTDCNLGEYCLSEKAQVTRDTRRLADIAEIGLLAEAYRQNRSSSNEYPQLTAGSYLQGRTVSTWPSWRDRFALDLGTAPPVDPLNIMGACSGYNPDTCWNESTKRFAGTVPNGLPAGSFAYAYGSTALDQYLVCAVLETAYSGVNNCQTP